VGIDHLRFGHCALLEECEKDTTPVRRLVFIAEPQVVRDWIAAL